MNIDLKTRQSIRYSTIDGIFASVMFGISDTFITPYALKMKASAALIGVLASVPGLVGALLQVKSASLAERMGSRRALINLSILAQALMWIPIIAIPYLFPKGQAVYLIIFYTLFIALGSLPVAAWSSLMSDYIPETERGKFFGWRNRVCGLVNAFSMLSAGLALSYCDRFGFLGFTTIFVVAFLARLVSWRYLTKMHEPDLIIKDEDRFTFLNFLKRMKRSNFGRFVIFVAGMNFATCLAAPFFAVYMLRDLKFDYITFTVVTMASTLTLFLMMDVWGRHADRVGNRRILRFTSVFIPLVPILWLVSHNVLYLIAIQIFAGFFWAGFNLSASNFIYDAVAPAKRPRCIAYFNVINGLAISSGAIIGGYLIMLLPEIFGYRILTLLLISGILRVLAAIFCSFVKEVRKVREISNIRFLYDIIGLKGFLGLKE